MQQDFYRAKLLTLAIVVLLGSCFCSFAQSFVPNIGQTQNNQNSSADQVLFTTVAHCATWFFMQDRIALVYNSARETSETELGVESAFETPSVERIDLVFEAPQPHVQILGEQPLPHEGHYYLPQLGESRRTTKEYQRLVYSNLYPGIDMVVSTVAGRIKTEFVVQPGVDPALIRWHYEGDVRVEVMPEIIEVKGVHGEWRDSDPVSYQGGKPVETTFLKQQGQTVGFKLGPYDSTQTLVVDPVLEWSTVFGHGSDNSEYLAVDQFNDEFRVVGGDFLSQLLPIEPGVCALPEGDTSHDLILQCFDAEHTLVWYCVYGGSVSDVLVDFEPVHPDSSAVWFVLSSFSADIPGVDYTETQSTLGGSTSNNVVYGKVNVDGMVYETKAVGGSDTDIPTAICATNDRVMIAGYTHSFDFPVSDDAFQASHASEGLELTEDTEDAFLMIEHYETGASYRTYYGGLGDRDRPYDMEWMGEEVWIVGTTRSEDLTLTPDAQYEYTEALNDGIQAWLTRWDFETGALNYGSYLGFTGERSGNAVALSADHEGAYMYVAGFALRALFDGEYALESPEEVHEMFTYSSQAYLFKLNTSSEVEWVRYFGGDTGYEQVDAISVQPYGVVVVGDHTNSSDFPVTSNALMPQQNQVDGSPITPWFMDGWVAVIDEEQNLVYATYFGGANADYIHGSLVLPNGEVYVCGQQFADYTPDFPVTPDAWMTLDDLGESVPYWSRHAFLSKVPIGEWQAEYVGQGEDFVFCNTVDSLEVQLDPFIGNLPFDSFSVYLYEDLLDQEGELIQQVSGVAPFNFFLQVPDGLATGHYYVRIKPDDPMFTGYGALLNLALVDPEENVGFEIFESCNNTYVNLWPMIRDSLPQIEWFDYTLHGPHVAPNDSLNLEGVAGGQYSFGLVMEACPTDTVWGYYSVVDTEGVSVDSLVICETELQVPWPSALPQGGNWTAIDGAATEEGLFAHDGPGTYEVMYEYEDACIQWWHPDHETTTSITVFPEPAFPDSLTSFYCPDAPTLYLPPLEVGTGTYSINGMPVDSLQFGSLGPGSYTLLLEGESEGCGPYALETTFEVGGPGNLTPIQTGNELTLEGYVSYQWYRYDELILGATNASYDAPLIGDYQVLVTDANGCTWWSDVVEITTLVGISDVELDSPYVYPNPANEQLTLCHATLPANSPVYLYSADGKVVGTWTSTGSVTQLSVDGVAPGMYVLRFGGEEGAVTVVVE